MRRARPWKRTKRNDFLVGALFEKLLPPISDLFLISIASETASKLRNHFEAIQNCSKFFEVFKRKISQRGLKSDWPIGWRLLILKPSSRPSISGNLNFKTEKIIDFLKIHFRSWDLLRSIRFNIPYLFLISKASETASRLRNAAETIRRFSAIFGVIRRF